MASARRNAELAPAGPSHARFATLAIKGIGHAKAHDLTRLMAVEPAMWPFSLDDIEFDHRRASPVDAGNAPAGHGFERDERQGRRTGANG